MSFDAMIKDDLILLGKAHNVALGDYCKKSKAQVIALLEEAGVPVPEPVVIDAEFSRVTVTEQAATRTDFAPVKKADALRDALLDVIGKPALDADAVRDIAADVIAKAMQNLPTRTETLVTREGKVDLKVNGEVSATVKRILKKVAAGVNVMLVGPAGCGKTTMAAQTAELLGKRFVSISCQAGMSISNFNGWLLPVGESGKFCYVPSEFVDAFEAGDALILIDEIDGADGNILLAIHTAIANGHMNIPQRYENPHVKRGAGVVIMATANTFGKGGDLVYVGRERLDEATIDRFRAGRIIVDYDVKFEADNVDETLRDFAAQVRQRIADLKLRRVLSTRWLLDATRCLTLGGETFAEVLDTFFCDWSQDDRSKVWA